MTRAIVCGGRDYRNFDRVVQIMDAAITRLNLSCVIHGNADGADKMAGFWAAARGLDVEPYPADWSKGKSAGPARNALMLTKSPDMVIAFPGGRGTADMVRQAEKAGVRVIRIDW